MTIDKTTRKSIFYLLPLLLFSLSAPLLGAESDGDDEKKDDEQPAAQGKLPKGALHLQFAAFVNQTDASVTDQPFYLVGAYNKSVNLLDIVPHLSTKITVTIKGKHSNHWDKNQTITLMHLLCIKEDNKWLLSLAYQTADRAFEFFRFNDKVNFDNFNSKKDFKATLKSMHSTNCDPKNKLSKLRNDSPTSLPLLSVKDNKVRVMCSASSNTNLTTHAWYEIKESDILLSSDSFISEQQKLSQKYRKNCEEVIKLWLGKLTRSTERFKTNNRFRSLDYYDECYRHISYLLSTYKTYKSLGRRLDDTACNHWIVPLFNKGTAALKAFVNASNKGTLTGKDNDIAVILNQWEKAIPQEDKLKEIKKAFQENVLANALRIIFSSRELPQYSDAAVLHLLKEAITKGRYNCYGEADDKGKDKIEEVERIKTEVTGRIKKLQSTITDATRTERLKTIAGYRSFLDNFVWEQEDGLFLIATMLTMTIIILTIIRACQSQQIRTAFSVNILPPALEQEEKRPVSKPKASKRKSLPLPTYKHTKRRQPLTPSVCRVYRHQFVIG